MAFKLEAKSRLKVEASPEKSVFDSILSLLKSNGVARLMDYNVAPAGKEALWSDPTTFTYAIYQVAHLSLESDDFKKLSALLAKKDWSFSVGCAKEKTYLGVGDGALFDNIAISELV